MDEKEFVKILHTELKKTLKGYSVTKKESLIYKIIVDEKGEFQPNNAKRPSRGNLAFQTDLLVKKGNLPLAVIEAKVGGFSTHDVLTYSTKAIKHKEVYPYLRYGLVVGNVKVITNKFFTHNSGLDFALAIENIKNLKPFVDIVKEQIKNSEILIGILKNKNKTKLFSTKLRIDKNGIR